METTYSGKFNIKDTSTGKAKTFTLNNLSPTLVEDGQLTSTAEGNLALFGVSYAAALGKTNKLQTAKLVQTNSFTAFDIDGIT